MAQIGHETGGLSLTSMRENMRFTTVARIIEVYRFRLQLCIDKVNKGEETEPAIAKGATVTSLAKACVNNPELLAAIVYGGRQVHRLRPVPDHPPQRLPQRDEGDPQAAGWRGLSRLVALPAPVFRIVWSNRLKWGSTHTPSQNPPAGVLAAAFRVGPRSAPMRHAGVEGCDQCPWFFATPGVAACWLRLGHPELSLLPAPRWLTFGHTDATLDRTGRLDN